MTVIDRDINEIYKIIYYKYIFDIIGVNCQTRAKNQWFRVISYILRPL